jgi:CubicO group peptidase (beta-lactamase class C family)
MIQIKNAQKWARNYFALFGIILNVLLIPNKTHGQELNTNKLDELFDSLEERNEAMGSIAISKNGQVLYSRAIGYRYISEDGKIPSDTETKYRIWSITKTFTATMILQLIEEGNLTLETKLTRFFPEIPNSEIINIKDMLSHKSGIHDFTQEQEEAGPAVEGDSRDVIIKNIARFNPDFQPNEKFEYSNSNYVLLGYIIEQLDREPYRIALSNRISSKVGLSNTFFGAGSLDGISNKAFSYQFDKKWANVDEGDFSGPIPGAAGSIVSTPADMAKFIEALFMGKLISESSLAKMTSGEDYGLGIFQMPFDDIMGYGHTGGYIASESSLTYYPQDSMAIAYTTNGIAYPKERILEHVLRIYHNKPFAVSMNRKHLGLIVLMIFLFVVAGVKTRTLAFLDTEKQLSLGYLIPIIFWTGIVVAGFLYGGYDHLTMHTIELNSFYSISGTFMAIIQFITVLFTIPFLLGLYNSCRKLEISFIPVLFIIFVTPSMLVLALFPELNSMRALVGNSIVLVIIGPLLAMILWRRKQFKGIRILSAFSFLIMLVPILILAMRSTFPELINNYFGLLQRVLYVGWSLWFISLGYYFKRYLSYQK